MARQAMDYNVATPRARSRLAPRPKPYYRQIGPGVTLGYIRRDGVAGSWQVRRKEGAGWRYQTLGQADDIARADGRDVLTYEQALRQVTHPKAAVSGGKLTVREAVESYLGALAGRSKHGSEYRGAANKHILPTLGALRVDRITKSQIEIWLTGLVREDADDPEARRRSQYTANRILAILKAALNAAFQDEANKIESDSAWRRARPFRKVARSRETDLEPAQIRTLIAKAATFDQMLANLIEAAYLTGARMGELAAASVRDLDVAKQQLQVDGKTGRRTVTLTHEAAAFLRRVSMGHKRDDPLLPKADGERWPRVGHFYAVKRAVALAELPSSVCIYTMRHSHISRAIEAGMPLSLIAENCGTSLLMIQKNYAKVLARTRGVTIERTAPKLRRVK
jgi:integrase